MLWWILSLVIFIVGSIAALLNISSLTDGFITLVLISSCFYLLFKKKMTGFILGGIAAGLGFLYSADTEIKAINEKSSKMVSIPIYSVIQNCPVNAEEKIGALYISCHIENYSSNFKLYFTGIKSGYLPPIPSLADKAIIASTEPHSACETAYQELVRHCPVVFNAPSDP